jgi:hypothetical protein
MQKSPVCFHTGLLSSLVKFFAINVLVSSEGGLVAPGKCLRMDSAN